MRDWQEGKLYLPNAFSFFYDAVFVIACFNDNANFLIFKIIPCFHTIKTNLVLNLYICFLFINIKEISKIVL